MTKQQGCCLLDIRFVGFHGLKFLRVPSYWNSFVRSSSWLYVVIIFQNQMYLWLQYQLEFTFCLCNQLNRDCPKADRMSSVEIKMMKIKEVGTKIEIDSYLWNIFRQYNRQIFTNKNWALTKNTQNQVHSVTSVAIIDGQRMDNIYDV